MLRTPKAVAALCPTDAAAGHLPDGRILGGQGMRRALVAALIALFALGSAGPAALAAHDANLTGDIGSVALDEQDGALDGSFDLTVDDGDDEDVYEVRIGSDTALDLDCFDVEDDLDELD